MKLTDGNKTVEIRIMRWNGSGYDPDWSAEYFNVGSLKRDSDGAFIVNDVDYCIDMACDTGPEGACCMWDADGDAIPDPHMHVFVDDL